MGVAGQLFAFTYDSLISVDQKGVVQPQLATAWQESDDSVTFTLRKGVTCSDGTALTPGIVAKNFEGLKSKTKPSGLVDTALGGPNYTVTKKDSARTVTIKTAAPFGFLLRGAGSVPIVCAKGLANPGILANASNGTGPFVLTGSVANDRYTLKRRNGYAWGPGGASTSALGTPAKVVFRVIPTTSTATNLLLTNGVNVALVSGADKNRLSGNRSVTTKLVPQGLYNLWFNQKPGHAAKDLAVRTALAQAIDPKTFTTTAGGGDTTIPTPTSLVSIDPKPCSGNTIAGNRPAYNSAAAKGALAGKAITMKVLYPTSQGPDFVAAMEYLSAQWQAAGVSVELSGIPDAGFGPALFGGDAWDAALLPMGVTQPSVLVGFLSGGVPPNGANFAGVSNSTYAVLSQQAIITSGSAGCKLWNAAESAVIKNVDVNPLGTYNAVLATRGTRVSIFGGLIRATSVRMLKS